MALPLKTAAVLALFAYQGIVALPVAQSPEEPTGFTFDGDEARSSDHSTKTSSKQATFTQLLGTELPEETSASSTSGSTRTRRPHKSTSSLSSTSTRGTRKNSSDSSKSSSTSRGAEDHADDKLNQMMDSKQGPLATKWIILIVIIVLLLFGTMAAAAFIRRRRHRAELAEQRALEQQQQQEDAEYYHLNEREPYAEI